jgi:hypothetical protein
MAIDFLKVQAILIVKETGQIYKSCGVLPRFSGHEDAFDWGASPAFVQHVPGEFIKNNTPV